MEDSVDHATDKAAGTATPDQQNSNRRAAQRHQEALPFGQQKEKVSFSTTQLPPYTRKLTLYVADHELVAHQ